MAITINIYYSGTDGNAKKFAEEMILSGYKRMKYDSNRLFKLIYGDIITA